MPACEEEPPYPCVRKDDNHGKHEESGRDGRVHARIERLVLSRGSCCSAQEAKAGVGAEYLHPAGCHRDREEPGERQEGDPHVPRAPHLDYDRRPEGQRDDR